MNRKGNIFNNGRLAGVLEESGAGCSFTYAENYLVDSHSKPICIAMPKRSDAYRSQYLFPFFHGLLSEGVTKEIQCRKLKIDEHDHFGRLLKTAGGDVIGSITVEEVPAS